MVTSDGWAEANLPALSSGLTQNRAFEVEAMPELRPGLKQLTGT
jgi:hypothetical protein